MSANDVVRIAMNKIFNNKEKIITGGFNYFRYLLFKFLPNKLILAYFYNKIKKRNIL
mgnify:FL=1